MRALDTALEWLRPLVETMTWDYCIVWQFGDDPSRYIEWNGCCCNGRQSVCRIMKEEVDVTGHDVNVSTLCRDTYVKHSVNSKACLKLANIPFHLPLYSGIHGEVAMSGQPSWTHDDIGTQVLIPVDGGMIELYISTHVTRDQQMVDALMAQFNIFSQHIGRIKTENSPNCSVPTLASAAGSTHVSPTQSIDNKPTNLLGKKQAKTKQKNGKDQYHSKNLVTERNRRNRIKDNLFTLRALVPNISKMDRASIVGDAIDYIKKLQTNIQELKDELERLEEDDDKSNLDEIEVCKPKKASPTKKHSRESTPLDRKPEVQVEVHQIGAKNFLVKLVCGAQQGGFSRIIETINSLELQVIDVNVTTYNGKVMTILQIEAKGKNFAAKNLKESLLESLLPGMVDDNTTRSD